MKRKQLGESTISATSSMAAIGPLLAFGFAESRLRREALSAWETLRTKCKASLKLHDPVDLEGQAAGNALALRVAEEETRVVSETMAIAGNSLRMLPHSYLCT